MRPNNITDDELIKEMKRFEIYKDNDITNTCIKTILLKKSSLLLTRQQAEIERLNVRIKDLTNYQTADVETRRRVIANAKSEAIKELLNVLELRVVCKQKTTAMGYESAIIDIKNLLKEMVGDDNA